MAEYHLFSPLTGMDMEKLRAGDVVYVTGPIYSGRGSAHRRVARALEAGEPLPFDPRGAVLYTTDCPPDHPGVFPGRIGAVPGSPPGREPGGPDVRMAEVGCPAVSFGVPGEAGVLLGLRIRRSTDLASEALGPEVLRELMVESLPVLVLNDCRGGGLEPAHGLEASLG